MSAVNRRLTNKFFKEKCKIIRHIENVIANKEASEKFGVPKNTTSKWMENKEKGFFALQETSSSTKKYVAVITKK